MVRYRLECPLIKYDMLSISIRKKKFGGTSLLLVVVQDCRSKKRTRGRALPAEKLLECTTTYMQQQIQQNVGKI